MECSRVAASIDSDTVCSYDSYRVAKTAVGAGITAIDGIVQGEFERAFCAVRPPGHHATPSKAMGISMYITAMGHRIASGRMILYFIFHHTRHLPIRVPVWKSILEKVLAKAIPVTF